MARRFKPMDLNEQVKYIADVETLTRFLRIELEIRDAFRNDNDAPYTIAFLNRLLDNVRMHLDNFESEHPRYLEIPIGASLEHTDDFDNNPLTLV